MSEVIMVGYNFKVSFNDETKCYTAVDLHTGSALIIEENENAWSCILDYINDIVDSRYYELTVNGKVEIIKGGSFWTKWASLDMEKQSGKPIECSYRIVDKNS